MQNYQYAKLTTDAEIRLLTVLPGAFDDDIQVAISHKELRDTPEIRDTRQSLKAVQATLPPNWDVCGSLDGRYLFGDLESDPDFTSWTHPDATVPASTYELPRPSGDPSSSYEALSYTWGTGTCPRPLRVVCAAHATTALTIQKNLDLALRYLRHAKDTRTLWVDAVCINQADIPERNQQVKRMAQIYRLARSVVAWLGPESPTSDGALAALDFIGAQVVTTVNGGRSSAPGAVHPLWYRQKTALPYRDDTWAAVGDLLARPWFSRLWVVQEIQLGAAGSRLQCGHRAVPWSRFLSAILCLYSKPQIEHSDSPCARRLHGHLWRLNRFIWIRAGRMFTELLYLAQGLGCVDPRDKIYGLLGLASPRLFRAIQPDYSAPAAAVYRSLFLTVAAETQRLDCLAWCRGVAGANPLGLPSWVPDWLLEDRLAESAGLLFASGYSRASYRVLSDTATLAVDGVLAGRVQEVRGPSPASTADVLSAIRAWASGDLLDDTYPTGESVLDAFTLVLYQYLLDEHAPDERQGLCQTREALRSHVAGAAGGHHESSSDGPLAYLNTNYLKWRVFLRTEDGRFGFGPSDALPGDVVAAVLGCASLLLLRPVGGDRFRIVGDCAIHGLGHAESLLGPLPAPWRLRFTYEFTTNYHTPHFYNADTEERTADDPRLRPLSPEWEKRAAAEQAGERTGDDPLHFAWFRNKTTGELVNSDPRMFPEALAAERGVPIRTFELV